MRTTSGKLVKYDPLKKVPVRWPIPLPMIRCLCRKGSAHRVYKMLGKP